MYLVTGATGHLGNNLIRMMREQEPDCQIRAFVLPQDDIMPLHDLAVDIVYGDILDFEALVAAMAGVDVVFHLAGMIAIHQELLDLIEKVNVHGAENVGRAVLATGVKRMVHVASIHIFERVPTGVIDETIPLVTKENAAGVYDHTKAEAVRRLRQLIGQGLDVVFACPTGVIGPHDYRGSEMGEMIRQYLAKSTQITLDGGYDWVDVRDVAQGLLKLAQKGDTGELYILSGHYLRMKDFIMEIGRIKQKRFRLFYLPYPVLWVTAYVLHFAGLILKIHPPLTPYSLRTVRDNANISAEKAVAAVGYTSRTVDETFREMLAWYEQHPNP